MRIELKCPQCGKTLQETKQIPMGKMVMSVLACGHKLIRVLTEIERHALLNPAANTQKADTNEILDTLIEEDNAPWNWQKLMPYQREGVEFGERANLRILLGDDPGLGKTVQALLMLDRNFAQATPCLIVCPPGIVTHWERFVKAWLQTDKYNVDKPHKTIYVHKGLNLPLPDDYPITIIGNNLLSGQFTMQSIHENGYKMVILDECHHFKSDKAERTKAMIKIAATVPHIVAMSGTPIMNRVDEYFPVLHMLKPEHWPTKQALNNICEKNARGVAMQIRTEYRQWFFERTKNYVIRRKKSDHLKGLPKFTRIPFFLDPESMDAKRAKMFAQSYNYLADQLEEALSQNDHGNILGILSTMRRITGEAKAISAADYAVDILDSDEEEKSKLIIGVHHKTTADLIGRFLNKIADERKDDTLRPLFMNSSQNATEKDAVQNEFGASNKRILVASILACAEGRDGMQRFCNQMLVVEREWNPEKEKQFEDRLNRYGQENPVQCIQYMMLRTVDEWFHELVELKRQIVTSALDAAVEIDPNMMRDLAQRVVQNRLKILGV
jgi:SWI/SNF-related matrix-associated actin-dependent regulator 1 of chromatin subfamily A